MKGKTKKIVLAVAVIGAIAAGGVAFTAANTLPPKTTAGYKQMAVSGATVTAINYTLDGTGENITNVKLTFDAATPVTGKQVKIAFNAAPTSNCVVALATEANCAVTEPTEGAVNVAVVVAD